MDVVVSQDQSTAYIASDKVGLVAVNVESVSTPAIIQTYPTGDQSKISLTLVDFSYFAQFTLYH
jgi:hypothetical protein